jgi:hypothetical protein
MIQQILVYIIVGLALIYTSYKVVQMFTKAKAGNNLPVKCAGCSGGCTIREKISATGA